MTIGFVIAIYFVAWWIVLFAVLPFGVTREADEDRIAGSDPGAPAAPLLAKKALATTLIAAIVTALIVAAAQVVEL